MPAAVQWSACLLLRAALALWPHSGEGRTPMFGDFEAQRHWLEVTVGLKVGDWYRQTTANDLQYWGLDYPPLTAYVSWVFGKVAGSVPALSPLVALHSSRGHESVEGKVYMRATVLLMDALVLLPAVFFIARRTRTNALVAASVPALLLIDHGHFQYNGVCIGLTLLAAESLLCGNEILASVLFCLSLNFKQMALYYAPVFFFALLRKAVVEELTIVGKLVHLIRLGVTVIFTFAILWAPFCLWPGEGETCLSSLGHVLGRQFPFERGIFEDKVANIWYTLSVLVDFRGFLSTPVLVRLSLLLTLLLLAPVGWCLLAFPISTDSLLLALVNSSLAFFLASFQVHEKSLLLALVPAVFFCQRGVGGSGPLPLQAWFQVFGCFTMFPLLRRDNLALAYVACNVLFIGLLFGVPSFESTASLPAVGLLGKWEDGLIGAFVTVSTAGALALHACEALLPPPARYPHLYPALISMYGAVNLLVFFTYTSLLHRKVVSSSAKLKQR